MGNREQRPKVVMVVAGFDPSGGAGITADIKTIAAHALYGTSVITALTVQSTLGVTSWEAVRAETVRQTIEAVIEDSPPAATKIGMLGSGEVADAVAEVLRQAGLPNLVLDPVIRSSSGADLIDERGFHVLRDQLMGIADVITPNLSEAGQLAGMEVNNASSMQAAAQRLRAAGAKNVVVTGGHLPEPIDFLAASKTDGTLTFRSFPGEHVPTTNTHGTGCAFSTALACNLAIGKSLSDSVAAAKEYVARALRASYPTGKGAGPVNHLAGMLKTEP